MNNLLSIGRHINGFEYGSSSSNPDIGINLSYSSDPRKTSISRLDNFESRRSTGKRKWFRRKAISVLGKIQKYSPANCPTLPQDATEQIKIEPQAITTGKWKELHVIFKMFSVFWIYQSVLKFFLHLHQFFTDTQNMFSIWVVMMMVIDMIS